MDGERFRGIVDGSDRSVVGALWRALLGTLEYPYGAVAIARNILYDTGLFRRTKINVPVISVGNLTLGGTGKSPMVAWVGRFFLEKGVHPGLISRGFGRKTAEVNDEFLELALRLPGVPHLQNPDRIAAARKLLERTGDESVDLLILDDAMQHRRIARDLEIVLIDATEPFGHGHLFPRGTLREPISSLRRADVVLLSRCDLVPPAQREVVRNRVRTVAPDVVWGEVSHRPEKLVALSGDESDGSELRGCKVFAFCGIGNPGAFRKTLERFDVQLVGFEAFPDHHRYTFEELERLENAASRLRADAILCTMKDFVKIDVKTDRCRFSKVPLSAVDISLSFHSGEEEVRTRLENLIP